MLTYKKDSVGMKVQLHEVGQTCEQRSGNLDLYTHAILFSPAVGQVGQLVGWLHMT